MSANGQIIILNGAPRSGKTSIARFIQENFSGVWLNMGVDAWMNSIIPAKYLPGIGLRPGGEHPELEEMIPAIYSSLYGSMAAASRAGLHVVADVGHHDAYSRSLHILPNCARLLAGLPVLFVGLHCPLDMIMHRRNNTYNEGQKISYEKGEAGQPVPPPVLRWQNEVHKPGIYDLEMDTAVLSPEACAGLIGKKITEDIRHPTAFERLALLRP